MTHVPPRFPGALQISNRVPRAVRVGLLALALFTLGGCGADPEVPTEGEGINAEAKSALTTPTQIAYGTDPSQFGELRIPSGSGPFPVAVMIHGGCWTDLFGLDQLDPMSADLTAHGVATWNIEFRRITLGGSNTGYPYTFEDVGAAIDKLRDLSSTYDLDLDRVVTVGHSAGGQLALWAAARPNLPTTSVIRGTNPLPLYGAVSIAGVLDLAESLDLDVCVDLAAQLLGGTPAEVPARYAETSPAELTPIDVPQGLIHGTDDTTVPISMSEDYYDNATLAGDDVWYLPIEDADHFDVIDPAIYEWPGLRSAILDCLDED